MRIANELHLRTHRAVLAAGGAALVGCATLGAITLGVANAQSSAPVGTTVSTAGSAAYVTMVGVQSVVGTGTTFSFTLPLALPV